MSNLTKKAKEVAKKIEKSAERGIEVAKDSFENVVAHLPFANLAKKGSDKFVIEVDLPGVKKEDIDLNIEDNILTVKAVRKMQKETKKEDYYLCESNFGLISRSFLLPDGIDTEKIEAKYSDGRVTIELEKEESRKIKKLSIS